METTTAARGTKLHVLNIKPPISCCNLNIMGVSLYISLERCLVYIVSELPFKFASLYSFTRHFVHFKKINYFHICYDSFVLVPALPKASAELYQLTP